MTSVTVEVCVDSLTSASTAARAGAHRLELCQELAVEGLTPSPGLVEEVLAATSLPTLAMLRPRAGGFCYTRDELRVIESDLAFFSRTRIAGFVFGALTPSSDVDREACRRVLDAAGKRPVTFHRAFDQVRDPAQALEDLVELGFARILTSGGAERASAGGAELCALVEAARSRIGIIAGGGVRSTNVERIVHQTGVREIHLSGRVAGSRNADEEEIRNVVARC